ncbi:hypothetical protein E1B28_013075 [Marasmius oreades]|uniref:Uncharacterized protein n=1 Tax=Marasmius oreades TaxID=181124 RepID=A0A9P7UM96_9AGAR|nr:uncharacterized protein E1B28_013075 [Marasmius oreades]KAG7087093.1 hypothetical protein E1B28_013075 [Marasmius oreades]
MANGPKTYLAVDLAYATSTFYVDTPSTSPRKRYPSSLRVFRSPSNFDGGMAGPVREFSLQI